jgi:hypothetical protein
MGFLLGFFVFGVDRDDRSKPLSFPKVKPRALHAARLVIDSPM